MISQKKSVEEKQDSGTYSATLLMMRKIEIIANIIFLDKFKTLLQESDLLKLTRLFMLPCKRISDSADNIKIIVVCERESARNTFNKINELIGRCGICDTYSIIPFQKVK
jgi:hypothetical protein